MHCLLYAVILTATLMPATHAQGTCTRNLCNVQVVLYNKIVHVPVNLIQVFSGTNFLHAIEHSSIPRQKLSSRYLELCNTIGRPVVVVFVFISFRLFSW